MTAITATTMNDILKHLIDDNRVNPERLPNIIEQMNYYGIQQNDRIPTYNVSRRKNSTRHPVHPDKTKREMFVRDILSRIRQRIIDIGGFRELSTKKGNTQSVERTYIGILKYVLDKMGVIYNEAPSQEPYDFRILFPVPMLLEMKKCDGNTVTCNDTLPMEYADYIIISTKYRDVKHVNGLTINPNGGEEYQEIYNRYKRHFEDLFRNIELENPIVIRALLDIMIEKVKKLPGHLSAYFRPTWSIKSIKDFFVGASQ
jgi:hypothetical protein